MSGPARTGGEWVVEALRAEGVRHVFGIPGIHNLAVYDALLRQDRIAHVLARHEAGAAFMADGYARSTGEVGVVPVTSGPGATNTLTPLAEAYAGSVPLLVLMSDVATEDLGREVGALHEVPNQIACFRPVCRMAEVVRATADIAPAIAGAFDLLRSGRPGPVALSIPHDLLTGRATGALRAAGAGRRPPCHVAAVAEAARHLERARRPVVIAGGGVVTAGASAELLALARRLDAPVITTVMGRGAIPEDDPLWQGVLPDRRATEAVLREADVILAVGTRLQDFTTGSWTLFADDARLVATVFEPLPLGDVRGRDVFFTTTAPAPVAADQAERLAEAHGCRVVGWSARLADRAGLAEEMEAAPRYDVLLTELKAAAVDVACDLALRRGAEVVFCDNRAIALEGEPDLRGELERTIGLAERRFDERR